LKSFRRWVLLESVFGDFCIVIDLLRIICQPGAKKQQVSFTSAGAFPVLFVVAIELGIQLQLCFSLVAVWTVLSVWVPHNGNERIDKKKLVPLFAEHA
jgi:hypothetical protein